MGLQVLISHVLGRRIVDLPPRPVDQPFVVGRGAETDLQVPSTAVSRRHCALFAHEGRWLVQDLGSLGGTFVNGQMIEGPTILSFGDVIALGNEKNPPTLTIDPQDAGAMIAESGEMAGADGKEDAQQAATGPAASPPPGISGVSSAMDQTRGEYALAVDDLEAEEGIASDEDMLLIAPLRRPRFRRRRKSSSEMYVWGGVFAGMICLVTVLIVWSMRGAASGPSIQALPSPKITTVEPPPSVLPQMPEEGSNGPGSKLFSYANQPAKSPPPPTPLPAPSHALKPEPSSASAGVPTTQIVSPGITSDVPMDDPRRQEPAWQKVENACYGADPVVALVLIHEYEQAHPATPFARDLDQYKNKLLDAIWWTHLKDLSDQREAIRTKIRQLNVEIAQEPSEYKKVLIKEKNAAEAKVTDLDERLRKWSYPSPDPVDLIHGEKMAQMRQWRDKKKYERWKEHALATIIRTHGQRMPW